MRNRLKINLYYHCNNCSFKILATIDKEELSDLFKDLIKLKSIVILLLEVQKELWK